MAEKAEDCGMGKISRKYFYRQICTSSIPRPILSPETERAVSPKVSPPLKIKKTSNHEPRSIKPDESDLLQNNYA